MKRLIILLVLGFLMVPYSIFAQNPKDLNGEQLGLRNELFTFLKEEGFMPEIDSDGDIKFKSEGHPYYIRISNTNDNPMYVVLFRQFSNPEEYSAETVAMASTKLNLSKGVKVLCFENSFRIGAELFVRSAEPVKDAFFKIKEIIDNVKQAFLDECQKVVTTSASITEFPFIATKLEVANVDNNSIIIQDYGETIWDYKTKYLKPRITLKTFKTSGTYTVYIKLYKNGTLQKSDTSPTGYTYSNTITLTGNASPVFELSGWGSNTSGFWSAGEYRFEIWYGDYCIGSKTFKVI